MISVTPLWPTSGSPSTGNPLTNNLIEQCNFYVSRLISQYAGKPRATGLIALLTQQALMQDLTTTLVQAFNLDTAVGAQLDILGKYIGVSRYVATNDEQGLFSLWDYASTLDLTKYQGTWDPSTDTPTIPAAAAGNNGNWYVAIASGTSTSPIASDWICGDVIVSDGSAWSRDTTDCGNGLTDYTDSSINPNGIFWTYQAAVGSLNRLTDPSYRALLRLKIISNSMDGTLPSLNDALTAAFGSGISVTDNQDMTLSYFVSSAAVPLPLNVLQSYLPKPMGVGISVIVT